MALFAMALSAQTSTGASEAGSAAAQAGNGSASAAQAASVSAELTKGIDSKNAKAGDPVFAKTMSDTRLADGTRIPKGSKLLGHVTDAQAKTKDNRNGYVGFCFDHAVLKDGHEVPVNAMVRTLAAPAMPLDAAGTDDPMAGGGMQGANSGARGGGLASTGPSSGGRGVSGVTGSVAGTAASGVNSAGSGINGTVNGAAGDGPALGTDIRAAGGAANGAAGAGMGASAQVGNLPGVTFATVRVEASAENAGANASGGATTGTMLTGHNKNATLDSGSVMTMSVTPR
jgi:hypothetical protein